MSAPHLLADDFVPGRDAVVDPVAAARCLRAAGIRVNGPVQAIRVRYQPGRSLRAAYADSGRVVAAVRTFGASRRTALSAATDGPVECGELGAVLWRFPHDRKLTSLAALLRADDSVTALVPGWRSSRLAGYAPEKCAVVECLSADGRTLAFVKHYADADAFGDAIRQHEDLHATVSHVRVPRILDACVEARAVAVEAAPGQRLADVPAHALGAALERLGGAAGLLHQSWRPRATVGHVDRVSAIDDAAALLTRWRPDVASLVCRLTNALAESRPSHQPMVRLHGDLHLKNAFVHKDECWLIDVDQAGAGPAAQELGGVLALLHSRTRTHGWTRTQAAELGSAFLRGYATVAPLPNHPVLAWHTAAALFVERGLRALTRLRRPLLTQLPLVLDDALTFALESARS